MLKIKIYMLINQWGEVLQNSFQNIGIGLSNFVPNLCRNRNFCNWLDNRLSSWEGCCSNSGVTED